MGNSRENKLEEAAIKTIAFFDLFDYPLTLIELWQWGLWPRLITLAQVNNLIETDSIKNRIKEKNGFYFLAGRENIITTRLKRYNYAMRKYKRLRLVIRLFKIIPWIKLAAIGNIIGANNLKDKSDIDVFIVADNKRVWLTRFFCASLMAGLNLRPKPGKERDKICLNFYISEEVLDLENLKLKAINDIYFIYWLACLIPLYDRDNTYEKLIKANKWLNKVLPNWIPTELSKILTVGPPSSRLYGETIDLFIGGLEPEVKKYQLNKLPQDKKTIMNKDTRVVVSRSIIKLHNKDRRQEYYDRWIEKINKMNRLEIYNEDEYILELASVL